VTEDNQYKLPDGLAANLRLRFGRTLTELHWQALSYVFNNRSDPNQQDNIRSVEGWLDQELGTQDWNPARLPPRSQPSPAPPSAPQSTPQSPPPAVSQPSPSETNERHSPKRDEIQRIARLLFPKGVPDGIRTGTLRTFMEQHWDVQNHGGLPDWKTIDGALGRKKRS
jgi:hypothetical protein